VRGERRERREERGERTRGRERKIRRRESATSLPHAVDGDAELLLDNLHGGARVGGERPAPSGGSRQLRMNLEH
jgi:hypothetical protein